MQLSFVTGFQRSRLHDERRGTIDEVPSTRSDAGVMHRRVREHTAYSTCRGGSRDKTECGAAQVGRRERRYRPGGCGNACSAARARLPCLRRRKEWEMPGGITGVGSQARTVLIGLRGLHCAPWLAVVEDRRRRRWIAGFGPWSIESWALLRSLRNTDSWDR